MRLGIGMLLFVIGGTFYPISLGFVFLQEWWAAAICFIMGASLIVLSITKFLYPKVDKEHD